MKAARELGLAEQFLQYDMISQLLEYSSCLPCMLN